MYIDTYINVDKKKNCIKLGIIHSFILMIYNGHPATNILKEDCQFRTQVLSRHTKRKAFLLMTKGN